MIGQLHVVICDGCCAIAKAKCGGDQRDALWTAPEDWSVGRNCNNVHFCPKCTKALTQKKEPCYPEGYTTRNVE